MARPAWAVVPARFGSVRFPGKALVAIDGVPMVEQVRPVLAPYKLVSRELRPDDLEQLLGGTARALHFDGT